MASADVLSLMNNAPRAEPRPQHASLLIIISASAIGQLGFALSLFAIWFGWLLPASLAPHPVSPDPDPKPARKAPRRSLPLPPPPPPMPVRRVSAPVEITPILASQHPADAHAAPRRVYFADQPVVSPLIRRNTDPNVLPYVPTPRVSLFQSIHNIVGGSPHSSVSSLVPTSTVVLPPPSCDCVEPGTPESDSSSRPPSRASSIIRTSYLQKLKLGLHSKTRTEPAHDKHADTSSITGSDISDKSSWRSMPCPLGRHHTQPDIHAAVEIAQPSPIRIGFRRRPSPARPALNPDNALGLGLPSDILSPTFLSRKAQKRVSAPIPRTSPYEAPYFATPPGLSDADYSAHLRKLPQFEITAKPPSPAPSATNTSPTLVADSDSEVTRGRGRGIKRVNLTETSRRLCIRKRKSASVDHVAQRVVPPL